MKHHMVAGLLMALAAAALADDYTCTTNLDNTITITGYTGPGGNVVIPAETNGRSITVIGEYAFENCSSLTGVTISSNVTVIGEGAFQSCASLTNVMIGSSVASIANDAFWWCSSLNAITVDAANPVYGSADGVLIDTVNTRLILCPEGKIGSFMIPNGITVIGKLSFADCVGVTQVTIPASVTNIEDGAFQNCTGLTALYFRGNAPALGDIVFAGVPATVYYLPGRVGWSSPFGGLTAVPLNLAQIQLGPGFGMGTNGFGFIVTGSNGTVVVVEASTNLTGGGWKPLKTNTLSGGSFLFRDPQITNYSRRFYRLRVE